MKDIYKKYGNVVAHNPWWMILLVIFITVIAFGGMQLIKTGSSDFEDMLPQSYPVIKGFNDLGDLFGGTDSIKVVLTVDPQYNNSNEVRDIRDPRVITYEQNIKKLASGLEDVVSITTASDTLQQYNNNRLPKSIPEVQIITATVDMGGTYNDDYTMSVIDIRVSDGADMFALKDDMVDILAQYKAPVGVTAQLGGTSLEDVIVEETIPQDMGNTTKFSLIGILIIILLVFRSIKYGITPLSTIIFGTIWTMGFVGLIGMKLTSQTSGVTSMIMGIGIDFGIQTVMRYRQEKERQKTIEQAMAMTLSKVIPPMGVTTLAALIGFQAMGLGELTFLGDMGAMMSYGVAGCFLAAITFVPAIIVILDRKKVNKHE